MYPRNTTSNHYLLVYGEWVCELVDKWDQQVKDSIMTDRCYSN